MELSERRPLLTNNENGAGYAQDRNPASPAMQTYQSGDREMSRRLHEGRMNAAASYGTGDPGQESGRGCGMGFEDGKAILFAASDGVLTSFAVISAGAGANLSWQSVLVMGVGNVFATAFIQGLGEYLASRTHYHYVMRQRARELWEIDNFRQGELDEMMLIYHSKYGVEQADAEILVNTMAKYNDLFVNVMMVEELGLMVGSMALLRYLKEVHLVRIRQVPEGESASLAEAIIMFLFFAVFAVCPLLGYAVIPMVFNPSVSEEHLFQIAVCVACGLLAVLGAVKSIYSLQRWYVAALEAFFMGAGACLIAFVIGRIAANILEAANVEQ